ncbi:hypothetical protein KI387_009988, partial [Taxus chinensis]
MCGGAIISQFIPTNRRATVKDLWPDFDKFSDFINGKAAPESSFNYFDGYGNDDFVEFDDGAFQKPNKCSDDDISISSAPCFEGLAAKSAGKEEEESVQRNQAAAMGVNGLQRSEIRERALGFGSELSILRRMPPGRTMQRLRRSEVRKPSSTLPMNFVLEKVRKGLGKKDSRKKSKICNPNPDFSFEGFNANKMAKASLNDTKKGNGFRPSLQESSYDDLEFGDSEFLNPNQLAGESADQSNLSQNLQKTFSGEICSGYNNPEASSFMPSTFHDA